MVMAGLIENSLIQKHLQKFNANILKISYSIDIMKCEWG